MRSNSFAQNQAVLRSAETTSVLINKQVETNGTSRTYLLAVPDGYENTSFINWPLIVDFHGRNGTPEGQWNNSQYYLNPSGRNYFVAYPLGCLGAPSMETAWQGAPYANPECNDLLFTADLITDVQASYSIDSTRIYASGKSNGGGFVDTLACSTTGDIFAAFAMAAAALYTDTPSQSADCTGGRPRAILEAHGADDHTIPFNGGRHKTLPNIPNWTRRWAERNGCPSTEVPITASPTWGENTTYSCLGTQNSVQQYRVDGLGHCWPSVVNNTDSQKRDGSCLVQSLDFTQAVVDFFAMWQKDT